LKIPPEDVLIGFLIEALSLLTLIQGLIGGVHITSFMTGALGGLMLT